MITNDRDYLSFEVRAKEDSQEMIVEGYAAVFDNETVMYSCDGVDYKEEVKAGAFDEAQMEDVVMNYNHCGKPVARTKNGTLELSTDERGLFVRANLCGTEEGRRMYEEIKGGYIDKMSFAFTVSEDSYNCDEHKRSICKVKRLYDVAAVDVPAYEQTTISARSYFSAEAEKEKAAEAERLRKLKRLRLMLEV